MHGLCIALICWLHFLRGNASARSVYLYTTSANWILISCKVLLPLGDFSRSVRNALPPCTFSLRLGRGHTPPPKAFACAEHMQTSADGSVYWDGHTTFIDSRFAELDKIKHRTTERVLKGGILAKSLRNLVKHYLPWVRLSGMPRGGNEYDILFPLDQAGNTSGPVLRGLLFPLFNDARDAYIAFGKIIDTTALPVHPL